VLDLENPDMHATWRFLNDPGYHVDLAAPHAADPEISWTSFSKWATNRTASCHAQLFPKKSNRMPVISAGCSSYIQWPEFWTTMPVVFVA
jgi:hypothetical protein